MFLRSAGLVKTERDAGICQPLVARDQGFFHGVILGNLVPFAVLFGPQLGLNCCNFQLFVARRH